MQITIFVKITSSYSSHCQLKGQCHEKTYRPMLPFLQSALCYIAPQSQCKYMWCKIILHFFTIYFVQTDDPVQNACKSKIRRGQPACSWHCTFKVTVSIVVDFDFSCESRSISHINIKLFICAYVPVPMKILYRMYFAKGT